ncbi:MAG: hypothetical protein ACFE7R_07980 [Candidatus Hodarchaeota archaeon]
MTDDLLTRLQAMYADRHISGYLGARLPLGSLPDNWVEKGLIFKGLKGRMTTAANRARYVSPVQETIQLMIDRAMLDTGRIGFFILGSQGLEKEKFVIILRDDSEPELNKKQAVAFWSRDYTPLDLACLISKYCLSEDFKSSYEEPNIDYIEQLKIDASDNKLKEAICLSIPKAKFNTSKWIKSAIENSKDSGVIYQYGKLRDTPAFGLLFSRWFTDLELQRSMRDPVAALVLAKEKVIEVSVWDMPRRIALFLVFKKEGVDEITRRLLLPAWAAPKEKIEYISKITSAAADSSQVVLPADETDNDVEPTVKIEKAIKLLEKRMDTIPIDTLFQRLGALEQEIETLVKQLDSSAEPSEGSATMTLLRNRLNATVERLEKLSDRLGELESRVAHFTSNIEGESE